MADDTTPAAPGRGAVFEPNPNKTVFYKCLRAATKGILKLWFRPSIEGPGVVPADGPVIIAPVHRSYIDFAFAVLLTDRKLFFMAKDSLWKWKWFGRFLLNMGAFPVHRESADRSALSHAEAVLASGQVLVLFPEGTRQDGPLVAEILEGAAFLAARSQATIVPVGIGGSSAAMPKGVIIPRPKKVHLYLGPDIAPPEKSEKGRVPRSAVHSGTEHLRKELQDAFDRASV
jgi:1-acyl-sn-glycerol-3-phosphate acyltransferase